MSCVPATNIRLGSDNGNRYSKQERKDPQPRCSGTLRTQAVVESASTKNDRAAGDLQAIWRGMVSGTPLPFSGCEAMSPGLTWLIESPALRIWLAVGSKGAHERVATAIRGTKEAQILGSAVGVHGSRRSGAEVEAYSVGF